MKEHTLSSRILELAVGLLARAFTIPDFALRLFRAANEMSGLDRKTVPTELIPLTTIQLARGLYNFTLLQSLDGWVLPYWAARQYDPGDPAFIPRSHLGLSINVTWRNWTAVGSPKCSIEPVIDPRGAVTPLRDRWSVDLWLTVGETTFFPSRFPQVSQKLLDEVPIVQTSFEVDGIRTSQTAYVSGRTLVHTITVTNTDRGEKAGQVAIAIRPFNPEGTCLLHEIRYDGGQRTFTLDRNERLVLANAPDEVHCSNLQEGDSAATFVAARPRASKSAADCPAGLANGYAAYRFTLAAGEVHSYGWTVTLEGEPESHQQVDVIAAEWASLLAQGTTFSTPDPHINRLYRSSVCTLLMLTDGDSLTPGPWTYHQFWFRDAAIMLRALDVAGYHNAVRRVILTFPSRQERAGYFRSQQGEWDSNGQALWTVWQHAVIANDRETPAQLFDSLQDGAAWIRKKRLRGSQHAGKPYEGLLPPGLSAEHLGLADYYFWDNWWSAAGLEAFARLCRTLGKASEEENVIPLLNGYRADIERAIAFVQSEKGIREIPAGPTRGIDCGMIGSCAAWYPLQELSPADPRMRQTLTTLEDRYVIDGLFFQHFIHSGKNPYLTLQMAHAWLYSGERERFWNMVSDVARHASPTLNYPEAIHPRTGGGAMGDGHHGWAAAEIVLALRDAFVYELWPTSSARGSLVILGGLPREWFLPGSRSEMTNAPVPGGCMSITTEAHRGRVLVDIAFRVSGDVQTEAWTLRVPLNPSKVTVNGAAAISFRATEQGVEVGLIPGIERTKVLFELDT